MSSAHVSFAEQCVLVTADPLNRASYFQSLNPELQPFSTSISGETWYFLSGK
jgi:hypothetical protein